MGVSHAKVIPPPVADIGSLGDTYSVIRVLGRGGMGSVLLAQHRQTGYQVAIRTQSTEKFDGDGLCRLDREARLMARCHHINIVALFEVQPIGEGRVGIVMEYVNGVSLATLLAEQKRLSYDACKG